MRQYSTLIIFIVVVILLIVVFVGILLSAGGGDETTTTTTQTTTTEQTSTQDNIIQTGYTPPNFINTTNYPTTNQQGTTVNTTPTGYVYRDVVTDEFIYGAIAKSQGVVTDGWVLGTSTSPNVVTDDFIMRLIRPNGTKNQPY